MGTGLSAFEAKMTAKAIPWQNVMAMIQALLAMFSGGICPKPPANKADLQGHPRKRIRLIVAYRRESGVDWATAATHTDAALATLDESDDATEVVPFLSDIAA